MRPNQALIFLLILVLLASCQEKTQTIDSYFQKHIEEQHIPGAQIYISDLQGNMLYSKAYGNATDQDPVTENSIFRLASMTKALTAVSILQLEEKGLISPSDPVSKYLPYFDSMMILDSVLPDSSFIAHPAQNQITIQQLLTHTSGLGYGFQNEDYNKLILHHQISEGFCPDSRTAEQNTRKIASIPLLVEPGTENIYSLSYEVLGTVVEEVSGQRFDHYVQENILDPLGMKNSYFTIPEEEQNRLVSVYMPFDSGLVHTDYHDIHYPVIQERNFFAGGSDLSATAQDYDIFLQMLVQEGSYNKHQILNPQSVKRMLSKQTDLGESDSYQGYAAWMTNEKGAAKGPFSLGSYGFGGFFDTYSWVDPEKGFKAVLFLQLYPNNEHQVHEGFQNIVYDIYGK